MRQFLSAAPLQVVDVGVWAAPMQPAEAVVRPASPTEVRQIEAVAPIKEDAPAHFGPQPIVIAAQPFIPATPRGDEEIFDTVASPVRARQEDIARAADPLPPILAVVVRFDPEAEHLGEPTSLEGTPDGSPPGPGDGLVNGFVNRGPLFGPGPFGLAPSGAAPAPPLPSPDSEAAAARGADAFGRYWTVLFEGLQPADFGDVSGMNGMPFDPHVRFLDLAHDPLTEARSTLSSPDTGHNTTSDILTTEADRHVSSTLAALFGQSAETDAVFVGRGRVLGDNQYKVGEGSQADEGSREQAVGYLVAFDKLALGWGLGAAAAAGQAPGASKVALSFLLNDLLTPSFSCDAAALSIAINDLVAQADEMGGSLLDVFSDVATSGEAALVTGIVGAGLAYHHWRGEHRRKLSEDRELLSARFIRGPASLRLHRRTPA
ncbi:MAG TPA: hypothetical protein VHC22_23915 [Pirellulales bacterium]|nr:hypothetical protein [Pirellulales bacterium]